MTSTEVDVPQARLVTPSSGVALTQATAIEQARAVAEVQAAVTVAQSVPRNIDAAQADMRRSCGYLGLANRAFYAVQNRGTGPSVHLARELARTWRNLDYGVRELRRDDAAAESEVQAFAWDQETNVRTTRTFVVPHARMKDGRRQKLTDLGDIYLSNQNIGARAVRECIFAILPAWFTEEAQDLCRATIERGDGEPLDVRIDKMVAAFAALDITVGQIEAKLECKRDRWVASDVATMQITFTSIKRSEITREEAFPTKPVTVEEIAARPAPAKRTGSRASAPPPEPAAAPPADATYDEIAEHEASIAAEAAQQEAERNTSLFPEDGQ